ncbi:MAG: hypothetical protein ABGX26_05580 [Nautiliaceae bacterium]
MRVLILFIAALLSAQTLNFIIPQIEINTSSTTTQPIIQTEELNDTFVSINSKAQIAVVINKKRFYKYIPSLMNSLIAYYSQKSIDYNITLYDSDVNLSSLPQKYILYYTTDKTKIASLKDYNKTFFLPLIDKESNSSDNVFFGGINFKAQIKALSDITDKNTSVITSNTQISKTLLTYEQNLTNVQNVFRYPNINYKDLNDSFVFLNTISSKTAQVLSKITQKNIQTKLNLTPQIGYSPLIILLTQPQDIEKLIIANSIINPPLIINEYTNLLNSDIKYNWFNYSTLILANKAYNMQNQEDEFYMSDFNIYIFDNQINYKTKLYRISQGAFKEVE